MRKNEYPKARTCIHALQLTDQGGLYVRETCTYPNKLHLPVPNKQGIRGKRPYIMAKQCAGCSSYKKVDKRKREYKKQVVRKGDKNTGAVRRNRSTKKSIN